MKYDVTLLTQACYIHPKQHNSYIDNVLAEDEIVITALQKHGLRTIRVAWDSSDFDWSSTRVALFRATWDYYHRYEEFTSWLSTVSRHTQLLNSAQMVKWNMDKHYLRDLSEKGVWCAATNYIEKGDLRSLTTIYEGYGHQEVVIKPVFSGSARHTYCLKSIDDVIKYESTFRELITQEAMMIQPFQHNIITEGEKSLVLIGEEYTHAVLKKAKEGDFRVQDDFGGSVHDYYPSPEEITFAQQAIASCQESPVYARVDIFNDNEGKITLAELELIEPELWFRRYPRAADHLSQTIAGMIT